MESEPKLHLFLEPCQFLCWKGTEAIQKASGPMLMRVMEARCEQLQLEEVATTLQLRVLIDCLVCL